MALRFDAKKRDPLRDEVRRENEREEQPTDSDRKAKSYRRRARIDRDFREDARFEKLIVK